MAVGSIPFKANDQIKEFEDQLGVALFVRANRTLRLTPAGEILLDAAIDALTNLDRAATRARRTQTQRRVQLNVTAPTSIAAKWLVPRLDRFVRKEPYADVRINVSCEIQDFDRDDVDVAIRFGPGVYPGLRADRLFEHVIFPVCSPRLLQSEHPLVSPEDLLRHPLIHESWSGQGVTWPDWRMWMQAAGVQSFEPGPGLRYKDTHLAIQAAIEGHGIALGDDALVADDLAVGRLVRPFDRRSAELCVFCRFSDRNVGKSSGIKLQRLASL